MDGSEGMHSLQKQQRLCKWICILWRRIFHDDMPARHPIRPQAALLPYLPLPFLSLGDHGKQDILHILCVRAS